MKYTVPFTTTISIEIMHWLKKFAEEKNTSQKAIIEEALKKYREEVKKKQLADSFKKAALDAEIKNMEEEGLDDYLHQLKSF